MKDIPERARCLAFYSFVNDDALDSSYDGDRRFNGRQDLVDALQESGWNRRIEPTNYMVDILDESGDMLDTINVNMQHYIHLRGG